MPTRNVTVHGQSATVPVPYSEGHPLTELEANVLNQTFVENVRNNCAKAVKEILDGEGTDAEKQKAIGDYLTEYAKSYSFAQRGSSGPRIQDPVEREARELAKRAIDKALKAQGKTKKDVDAERYAARVTEIAKSKKIMDQARKNVEAAKTEAAQLDLSDLTS